ncbi:chromosome partitioning protein ParA [Brucella sp. 21LCYQ03]|nr:chromosome partitioning protein ParA [Brucella sp. 21LCYQ03]
MSDSSISVKAVANRLIAERFKRVVAVSPEGDDASATTVKLSRELADRRRRVIFIDMTALGTMGRMMLDSANCAGITELLAGERSFKDVIHTDNYSQAHVMPLGRVAPEIAMRAAARLPHILDALETAYDFVVVECGASTSRQIGRITHEPVAIIMNIVDPDDSRVLTAAVDMDHSGYEDVIILMDVRERSEELYVDTPQPAA